LQTTLSAVCLPLVAKRSRCNGLWVACFYLHRIITNNMGA